MCADQPFWLITAVHVSTVSSATIIGQNPEVIDLVTSRDTADGRLCIKPAMHIPVLQLPTCWRLLFQWATQMQSLCVCSPPTVENTFCGHLASGDLRPIGSCNYSSADKLLATKRRYVYGGLKCVNTTLLSTLIKPCNQPCIIH